MTQVQLVRTVAGATGDSTGTVRRLGFHLQPEALNDPPMADLRLVVDCPSCRRPVPYPGYARDGSPALMLFDSWAGLLPPAQFERQVIEPGRRIVSEVRRQHPSVPIVGFPRLGGLLVGRYAARTGIDALALDTSADLALAAGLVPPEIVLQGNLDPLCLLAGGDALPTAVEAIRQRPARAAARVQPGPWRAAADAAGACRPPGRGGAPAVVIYALGPTCNGKRRSLSWR